MQLSNTEMALVERLKTQQQSLIRWRWVGVVAALFNIALGCYGIAITDHFLNQPEAIGAMFVAFLIPTTYLLVLGGVWMIVYLSWCWNGKPETRLLLKLIEESRHDA
jgi:hypothetical protein